MGNRVSELYDFVEMAIWYFEIVEFSFQRSDGVDHAFNFNCYQILYLFYRFASYFLIFNFAVYRIYLLLKMENTKSIQSFSAQYWCHYCRFSFKSDLIPGKDIVLCPKCNHDFCQVQTRFNHPERFKPYEKKPLKKPSNAKFIDREAIRVTVHELAQIMEIKQSQNFELEEHMLKKIRKTIQQRSECSVCRTDLQKGQEAIVPECKHTFHQQCLVQWIKRKNSCPTCRRAIIKEG